MAAIERVGTCSGHAVVLLLICLMSACHNQPEPAAPVAAQPPVPPPEDTLTSYVRGVQAFRAKDFALARQCWKRSTELGSHFAEHNLGYLLYVGLGGPVDSLAGEELWRRSGDWGVGEAQFHIAQAIFDGNPRLGSAVEGYAHAITAKALSQTTDRYSGENIVREARELMASVEARLSTAERASADSLSEVWIDAIQKRRELLLKNR